jgi:hypothetical protein
LGDWKRNFKRGLTLVWFLDTLNPAHRAGEARWFRTMACKPYSEEFRRWAVGLYEASRVRR